ncbi:MAG: type II toxin-antitoxin system VapC family toxin [Thiobacillus sp.]
MNFVLDTSALLTKVYAEPGAARVDAVLLNGRCLMSSLNLAEFASKCSDQGMAREDVEIVLDGFDIEIVEFDAGLALCAGVLRAATRHPGLSLGDRACLALAQKLGATALTADRAWVGLDLGIAVECLR